MLPSIWSARILAKLEKNLVFAQPGVVNRDYEGDIRADGDRAECVGTSEFTTREDVLLATASPDANKLVKGA